MTTPDPREMGSAWADLDASMPEGADFDRLEYFPADDEPAFWSATVELALQDRCQHVDRCRHRAYRPDVAASGSTAPAAIRALAAELRSMTPDETAGDAEATKEPA